METSESSFLAFATRSFSKRAAYGQSGCGLCALPRYGSCKFLPCHAPSTRNASCQSAFLLVGKIDRRERTILSTGRFEIEHRWPSCVGRRCYQRCSRRLRSVDKCACRKHVDECRRYQNLGSTYAWEYRSLRCRGSRWPCLFFPGCQYRDSERFFANIRRVHSRRGQRLGQCVEDR